MKVDSTIVIASPGQQLFFKAVDVKSYPAFDRLYGRAASLRQGSEEIFHTTLVPERRQFKRQLLNTEVHRHRTSHPQPRSQPQEYEVIDLSACSDSDTDSEDRDDASTVVGGLTPQYHSHKANSLTPGPLRLVADPRHTPRCDGR